MIPARTSSARWRSAPPAWPRARPRVIARASAGWSRVAASTARGRDRRMPREPVGGDKVQGRTARGIAKDREMKLKKYGRSAVMGILAGVLYGLWAVYANWSHDAVHVARAAGTQFVLSFCSTSFLTL